MSGTLTATGGGSATGSQTIGSTLDYTLDFSQMLATGDTITAVNWLCTDPSIQFTQSSTTDTTATVWINGGTAGWFTIIATVSGSGNPAEIYQDYFSLQIVDPNALTNGYFPSVFANIPATLASIRRDRLVVALQNYGVSSPITDDYLVEKLQAAEAALERRLRVFFTPRQIVPPDISDVDLANLNTANGGLPVVEEPGYDYEPQLFQGDTFGLIVLRNRPLIAVQSIVFAYPAQDNRLYTIPKDWVRADKKVGRINLVPTQANFSIPLDSYILSVLGGGMTVPLMMQITYTAGLQNVARDYPDLLDAIKRQAILSILDDLFIPGSGSVSADGLSQTISFDIANYQKFMDARLDVLENSINGIRVMVL